MDDLAFGAQGTAGDRVEADGRRAPGVPWWVWQVLIFATAVGARLTMVVRHGGARGYFGYDSGVYFAGSDALIHGRLPYRDFVQLHPPAIDLVLTPFVGLTKFVSDDAAFAVGIVAFVLLGGVNAVLIGRVCLRLGLGRSAALAAAATYALWFGSVEAEYLIKLEPLGNLFLLLGLLFALRAERDPDRRWLSVLAGVPLGLAVSTKIWWLIPVLGVVVWHVVRLRSVRRGATMLGGAIGTAAVVNLPFFIAAPRQMWHMVFLDQLGRPRHHPFYVRLSDLTTLPRLWHLSTPERVAAAIALLVVLIAIGVVAWGRRAARPAVCLLALQLALLLSAPSWYPYYCDFLTVGLALSVGGAVATVRARARQPRTTPARPRALLPLVGALGAALTVAILAAGNVAVPTFAGGPQLSRAVRHVRCVTSDSPVALIQLDALSRGLADGCPNWVDISGRTYGADRSSRPLLKNGKWHRALLAYLRSGQATIVVFPHRFGVTRQMRHAIARDGVLARVRSSVVYRVTR